MTGTSPALAAMVTCALGDATSTDDLLRSARLAGALAAMVFAAWLLAVAGFTLAALLVTSFSRRRAATSG